MSQSDSDWSPQDRGAAAAVVNHHAQLADGLTRRAEPLLSAAEAAHRGEAERARRELLDYLHSELVPHALAEEGVLYPAAADLPGGRLLIDGMLDEHRTIVALIKELESAQSPTRAAGAARALAAVFGTHLTKENTLVIPLIASSPKVSLADLLAGMHELLGGRAHGGADQQEADEKAGGGCGCGGGCGGGSPDAAAAAAPMLTIDPRLDVRDLPHGRRHAAVLGALDGMAPGGALVLVAPHAPHPLLAEIERHHGTRFEVEWLQSGPDVWQVRLLRTPARV